MSKQIVANLFLIFIVSFRQVVFAKSNFVPKTGDTVITLFIHINNPGASTHIRKAPLKYNKSFAYSLTFDDGLVSAYRTAFPLMNGGAVSDRYIDEWKNDQGGDGNLSEGLCYSDGCGNRIPFRASIAINAKNIQPDSIVNRGHLSWLEVSRMVQAGWSVMNHGYAHATKDGTDYKAEVKRNIDTIAWKLNLFASQFIVPGGEGPQGYDLKYTKSAFQQGSNAVGGNVGQGPIIRIDQALNLVNLAYRRSYVNSNKGIPSLFKDENNILDSLFKVNLSAQAGRKYWFNEFTHSTGNDNLWGISLKFKTLRFYLENVAKLYGIEGKDNIWMAPFEEVYDYLRMRDAIKTKLTWNENLIVVRISVPQDLLTMRYRAVTLLLSGTNQFSVISPGKQIKLTYNSQKGRLITIEF